MSRLLTSPSRPLLSYVLERAGFVRDFLRHEEKPPVESAPALPGRALLNVETAEVATRIFLRGSTS